MDLNSSYLIPAVALLKPKSAPEAISVAKAAEILGVHHLTIRRWIRQGWVKAYRIGPLLIRIPRSEISRMRTLRIIYSDNYQRPRYPKV